MKKWLECLIFAVFLVASVAQAAIPPETCQQLLVGQALITNGIARNFLSESDLQALLTNSAKPNPLATRPLSANALIFSQALDRWLKDFPAEETPRLHKWLSDLLQTKLQSNQEQSISRAKTKFVVMLAHHATEDAVDLSDVITLPDGRPVMTAFASAVADGEDLGKIWIGDDLYTFKIPDGNPNTMAPVHWPGGGIGIAYWRDGHSIGFARFDIESGKLVEVRNVPFPSPEGATIRKVSIRVDRHGRSYVLRKTKSKVSGDSTSQQPMHHLDVYFLDEEGPRVLRSYTGEEKSPLEIDGADWSDHPAIRHLPGSNQIGIGIEGENTLFTHGTEGRIELIEIAGDQNARISHYPFTVGDNYAWPENVRIQRDSLGRLMLTHLNVSGRIEIHHASQAERSPTVLTVTEQTLDRKLFWATTPDQRALLIVLSPRQLYVFEPEILSSPIAFAQTRRSSAITSRKVGLFPRADGGLDIVLSSEDSEQIDFYRLYGDPEQSR